MICGLISSEFKTIKKYLLDQKLVTKISDNFVPTKDADKFIENNPMQPWTNFEFPLRPNINLEYLKVEKTPAIVSRAIGLLAQHLLDDEPLKEGSLEQNIYEELIKDSSACLDIKKEIENYVLSTKRVKMTEFFEKFTKAPYGLTKSLASILLLDILAKNKNHILVYRVFQLEVNLNYIVFSNLIGASFRYEIQKAEFEDVPLLYSISEKLLKEPTCNVLSITRELVKIEKGLDTYTFNTKNLTPNTVRFRNLIKNAEDPVVLLFKDIPRSLCQKDIQECSQDFIDLFMNCVNELKSSYTNLLKELTDFLLKSFEVESRTALREKLIKIKEYIGSKELNVFSNNIIDESVSDKLWIERIAVCVNKSLAPEDWSDEDLADFKIKIKDFALKILFIESTAGISEVKVNSMMAEVLNQLLQLSKPQRLTVLRKAVNG